MTAVRTLVVEDDPDCAEAMGEILTDAGHQPLHAAGPGEALAAVARDAAIGVIVLDLHLPEMDGLKLLRQLRAGAGPRGGSVQALLCSGAAGPGDLDTAMRLGVVAYLPKPIERVGLLNAMSDAVRRYHELEADRAARAGLIERFRALEDGMAQASREMSSMLDLPAAPSSQPGSPSADAPGLEQAWQAMHCERLAREARQMDRLLGRLGVDGVEWRILLALREADLGSSDASATNIALACGASASAGLRRIMALEGRGLIDRREDPRDGRRAMLTLTAAGRAVCVEVVASIVAGQAGRSAAR